MSPLTSGFPDLFSQLGQALIFLCPSRALHPQRRPYIPGTSQDDGCCVLGSFLWYPFLLGNWSHSLTVSSCEFFSSLPFFFCSTCFWWVHVEQLPAWSMVQRSLHVVTPPWWVAIIFPGLGQPVVTLDEAKPLFWVLVLQAALKLTIQYTIFLVHFLLDLPSAR